MHIHFIISAIAQKVFDLFNCVLFYY